MRRTDVTSQSAAPVFLWRCGCRARTASSTSVRAIPRNWAFANAWSVQTTQFGSAWTDQIAKYTKSIDPNHMVMDGHYGIQTTCGGTTDTAALSLSSTDLVSNHAYDQWRSPATVAAESQTAASYNKPYSWASSTGPTARTTSQAAPTLPRRQTARPTTTAGRS